jgi:hypothetical protein
MYLYRGSLVSHSVLLQSDCFWKRDARKSHEGPLESHRKADRKPHKMRRGDETILEKTRGDRRVDFIVIQNFGVK